MSHRECHGWLVGTRHAAVIVDGLTRTQIVQYAGASGDFNPLHTDEVYATEVAGFPSVFAHGMLTMALTGRALTEWLEGVQLTRFGGRFTAQVWPGDTLTVIAEVIGTDDEGNLSITFETRRQNDVVVFAGSAEASVDRCHGTPAGPADG
jgi:acyl dehydratase